MDNQANVYVTGKSDGGHGYSIATVKFVQSPTQIDPVSVNAPESIRLEQNYPNPFNPVTRLEFGISKLGFVSLKVYDILGKEVKALVNEIRPAGTYSVSFDGSNLSSGVYYYRLESGRFTEVKRMVLLK